jgi:hypothetical protein
VYYQNQDENNTGDLKKYLSIFGWEVDKVRTTLDFSMAMKDPFVGNEETLNFLAQDMGVPVTTNDLGSQRLRELLKVVSTTRRNNGSPSSIEKYLEAICGANVEVNSTNKTIKVYSERVNLLKDPRFVNGVAAGIDGGYPSSSYGGVVYDNGNASTSAFTTPPLDGGTPSTVLTSATPTTQSWLNFSPEGTTGTSILETGGITYAVSNAVYSSASSGTFTYTTTTPHNFTNGDLVDITGVSPSGYNKSKQSVIVLSTTSFKTIAQGNSPGTFSTSGKAYKSYSYVNATGGETFYFSINVPGAVSGVKDVQGAIKSVSFWTAGGAANPPEISISSASYSSFYGTTTYNTTTPHGFVTGQTVAVTGVTPSDYDHTSQVVASSPTQFYFIYFTAGVAYSSGGTAVGREIVTDVTPQVFGSTKYWRLEIPSTVTSYRQLTLSIEYYNVFQGQSISYNDFAYTLLERDYIGTYFDGNTVEGGWLLSGLSTGSISDYRWLGEKDNSYSVYSTNWKKTQQVVSRFLQSILPVPELLTSGTLYSNGYYKNTSNVISKTPTYKYAVTYDVIPGDT